MKKILLFYLTTMFPLLLIAHDFSYTYEGQTVTYTVIDEASKTCKTKDGVKNGIYPYQDKYGKLSIPEFAKDGNTEYKVVEIGNYSFYQSGFESLVLPNSIITVGRGAFFNSMGISSITLSNSLVNICDSAFYQCKVSSLKIPNTVTTIGKEAFKYINLSSITIPSSVTHIGAGAFVGGLNLNSFVVEEGNKMFSTIDGVLYNYDKTQLVQFPGARSECMIPETVTTIGDQAFYYNQNLTEIILPNSVKSIGESAFSRIIYLASFNIPNSVTEIGAQAFAQCSRLTTITLPEKLKKIPNRLFSSCTRLANISIPESVNEIGERAFESCKYLSEITIPESVNSIGDGCFYMCERLNTVHLNASLTVISKDCFNNCYSLSDIIIPGTVSIIESHAFDGCLSLTSINIPSSVKSIGYGAFRYCSSLEKIDIPNSVDYIGEMAFNQCVNLSSVWLSNSLRTIETNAFSACQKLTEIVIPNSVETIQDYAFSYCGALSTINLGYGIKHIGKEAFNSYDAQHNVRITAQIPPITFTDSFSNNGENYAGVLSVQGKGAQSEYQKESSWRIFKKVDLLIEPSELKINEGIEIKGKSGDTFQLTAAIKPENVTLPYIFWRSTDPEVAYVDANGLVTLKGDIYGVSTCKIIAESLYADGPIAEVKVGNTSVVEELFDECLNNTEIDYSISYDIYNLNGVMVGNDLNALSSGFYIIRQDSKSKKIVIK